MDKKTRISLVFFIILILAFFVYSGFQPKQEEYSQPSPENVVRLYFTAWSNKDYPDMYSTLSDGFKKIESTANDLAAFKSYVESQKINNINIIKIKEKSNDRNTAIITYAVEFTLSDDSKEEFNGEFILKYKKADIIQGWKLIHPYGDNIDNS